MTQITANGTYHVVEQGECLSSIASQHGVDAKTVWNRPENAQLKQERKDPNVLRPGDELFVPALEVKTETGATEQKHRFRKKNTPAKLRLRLFDEQFKPRSGVSYKLQVDGVWSAGTTDQDGQIEQTISPEATEGLLVIENEGVIPLQLGALDPVGTNSGVRQRLRNLGYDCGETGEEWDEPSLAALHGFQTANGLSLTAAPDEVTRNKLVEKHGS